MPEPDRGPPDVPALIAAHLPALRAFVRLNVDSFLRERESCSDLVQSVCKDLLGRHGTFEWRDPRAFRNWLYTAVLNKIRDHERWFHAEKRDPAREVRLDDAGDLARCYSSVLSPSQHAIAKERAELLERAFERMPESYREVLTLSRILGQSHEEIAESLGKTATNVRVLLCRALARLTTVLAELDT